MRQKHKIIVLILLFFVDLSSTFMAMKMPFIAKAFLEVFAIL